MQSWLVGWTSTPRLRLGVLASLLVNFALELHSVIHHRLLSNVDSNWGQVLHSRPSPSPSRLRLVGLGLSPDGLGLGVLVLHTAFLKTRKSFFFQRACRIIVGPPKHDLHLVWSAYFISTAVRTALKVARTPQILGGKKAIIEAIIKAKNHRFWDGTKCKMVWQFYTTPPNISFVGILLGWPFKTPKSLGWIPTVAIPNPDQPPLEIFFESIQFQYQNEIDWIIN